MEKITEILERLNHVTNIPLTLLDGGGRILQVWPPAAKDTVSTEGSATVIEDFRLQKRDRLHPLVSFLDPGFLLGVVELDTNAYILSGLVSPYVHSRADILQMVGETIAAPHLQSYCDRLMKQPLVSLEQMKDLICLLTGLLGAPVARENILFVDNVATRKLGVSQLDRSLFELREEAEFHVPVDFETAICSAVEAGDRALLERSLFAPPQGRVGRMSMNDLRQQKYSFICMATLVSRAAIRGGMDVEDALTSSDAYIQECEMLTDISRITRLQYDMVLYYTRQVQRVRLGNYATDLVRNVANYVQHHLSEAITTDQVAGALFLSRQHLSRRFTREAGIPLAAFIRNEKAEEGKRLLRYTDRSVSSIAAYLGFSSQGHFSKVFKEITGMTPGEYREKKRPSSRLVHPAPL